MKDTHPVILIFQNPAPEILEWAQNLKPELGVFERGSAPSVSMAVAVAITQMQRNFNAHYSRKIQMA